MSRDAQADAPIRIDDLEDGAVDDALDRELRRLLNMCFARHDKDQFRFHRYNYEMPQHRWLARDRRGTLCGHLAIHDKTFGTTRGDLRVAGVAEVCVHPDQRGRGLARDLLGVMHQWTAEKGFPFAVLFGKTGIYNGSGYAAIENPLHLWDPDKDRWVIQPDSSCLVRPLTQPPRVFPTGQIDLRGPRF